MCKRRAKKGGLKLNIQKTKIKAPSLITPWQRDGETMETVIDLISWVPKSLQMVIAAMKLKDLAPWKKNSDKPREHVKKQRHYFANKGPSSPSYGFSSSNVQM